VEAPGGRSFTNQAGATRWTDPKTRDPGVCTESMRDWSAGAAGMVPPTGIAANQEAARRGCCSALSPVVQCQVRASEIPARTHLKSFSDFVLLIANTVQLALFSSLYSSLDT
jgi:hypothetical protein